MDMSNSENDPGKTALGTNIHPKTWRFLGYSITLLIIYFSLNPTYPLKRTLAHIPFSDPTIHIISFGLLVYCFCLSWKQKKIQIFLVLGLIILSITLEILQALIGAVDFSFKDSIANTLGVGLGYLVASFWK